MAVAIAVENLSKKYIISHQPRERYTALRDVLTNGVKHFAKKLAHPFAQSEADATHETFWALKDVSFEIEQGNRVGIIGRNGAGKSTLLKLLSRITEPTSGRIRIRGRVSSLLEVGTGFHPELTGRENIFLNGAILGMTKAEMRAKFDEIVAFAEVEKFLDTPVKRYSSGMYVRLAFAVAAHLEPEILIVDEVLAVGDAQFQKKCLGKMEDVGKEGRTVLFVSHNMNAISTLCSSAAILHKGALVMFSSDVQSAVHKYLQIDVSTDSPSSWSNTGTQYDNPFFRPANFSILDKRGYPITPPVKSDADLWIEIRGYVETRDPALTIGYALFTDDGTLLYWSYHTDTVDENWSGLPEGLICLRSRLPSRFLNEGDYRLELIGGLHCREWLFKPGATNPQVNLQIRGGLSNSPYWLVRRPGLLAPPLSWEFSCESL